MLRDSLPPQIETYELLRFQAPIDSPTSEPKGQHLLNNFTASSNKLREDPHVTKRKKMMGVTQGFMETSPFKQDQSEFLREKLGVLGKRGSRLNEQFFPGTSIMFREFEVFVINMCENVFYLEEKSKQVALSMAIDLLTNWLKF